jgi:hypothetical protein
VVCVLHSAAHGGHVVTAGALATDSHCVGTQQRMSDCARTAVCVLPQATTTSWTLWVKPTDTPGAQYEDMAASPAETVAQFKRRWAAAKRPSLDPSLVSLRLVKRSPGVPSDKEDADALERPTSLLADPSQTVAHAGVSDGCRLLAVVITPQATHHSGGSPGA